LQQNSTKKLTIIRAGKIQQSANHFTQGKAKGNAIVDWSPSGLDAAGGMLKTF
jgi:hypothetical protein